MSNFNRYFNINTCCSRNSCTSSNCCNQCGRGIPGPVGPQGPVGARGVQGEKGDPGTILGSYDTLAELIAAHPTGNQGDAYLVDGILYIWDTASGAWVSTGTDLRGPQGEKGDVGTILGSYDTLADLVADHPTGNQGDAYLVDGVLYIWDTTSGAWVSTGADLRGPQGEKGDVGTILGSYDSLANLIAEHPTGNQGDAYLVDGMLYVWDTDTNSWKAVGNLRPNNESIAIIPFASQVAPRTYINGGVPSRVSLLGFGYGDSRDEISDLYSFPINSDLTFVIEGTNDNRQLVFSLPFDMIIKSIALTTGNWGEYFPSGTVFPYVQLYSAGATSNNFAPLEGATAIPLVGHNPGTVPANTMLSALTEDLDIRVRAGTRIAIGALAKIEGDTAARDYYLYFTGSIGMTRWVE